MLLDMNIMNCCEWPEWRHHSPPSFARSLGSVGRTFEVLEAMWPVLDSPLFTWEQLHEVGLGHLVFVAPLAPLLWHFRTNVEAISFMVTCEAMFLFFSDRALTSPTNHDGEAMCVF